MRTIICFLLAACGTDPTPPILTSPDAPPPPDVAFECTDLELPADDVREVMLDETAPAFTGGTLVPGTYELTAATIYTGAGGATGETGRTLRALTVNDGAQYEYIQFDSLNTAEPILRMSGGYTLTGTHATIGNVCPGGDSGEFEYVATPTTFTLFSSNPSSTTAITFTRR